MALNAPFHRLSLVVHHAAALALLLALTGCSLTAPSPPPPPPPPPQSRFVQLPISGIFQETSEWCWAAVGEMVLRYYSEPNVNPVGNYQCGEIGVAGAIGLLPPVCQFDCTQCVVGIGNGDRLTAFLQSYPMVATALPGGQSARPLSVTHTPSALSLESVAASIDASQPIIAGITPNNIPSPLGPAHATLIVGYDTTNGRRLLFVNDPFPYAIGPLGPYGDPYLTRGAAYIGPGRYAIDYATFAGGLFWTDSIVAR